MRNLLPLIVLCFAFLAGSGQDFSNKGKDFWIGYGNHVRMFNAGLPESMELYITSDVNTIGQVTIPGIGFVLDYSVTANQITTLQIPRTAALLTEGVYNLGIHITAEQPVVVYSFIYVNAISGATLCLPTATLGREYYSINYKQVSNEQNSYSYFFAVATDTGTTTVEVIPSQNSISGKLANVPFTVTLKQGEVYQLLSTMDLTGSSIRSISTGSGCKKISVFSGSGKIAIGCTNSGTSDNLYQQMYPTSTWGKTYLTAPSVNPNLTNQNNYIRVFKSNVGAEVKLNGTVIPAANFINGRYSDIALNVPVIIESDMPILVAQYFTTQGCGGNSGEGDPEMIYLNPVEQTINKVTLNSMQPTANTNIDLHYINVIIKNTPGAINSFRIDGASFVASFKPHPNAPGFAYAQIPVSKGTHNLTSDTAFNAISYGFGNAESYGYSAGTNLKDLYQFISIANDYGTIDFPAGCRSSPFKFSMTFPYQPTKITWKFGNALHGFGFVDTTLSSPVYDSTWVVNGRVLYRYQIDRSYQINTVGSYPIHVTVINPISDGCSGEQEIDYDLQIFERPKAAFTFNHTGCVSDTVTFTSATNGLGRDIIKYSWDFGDAVTSGVQHPNHLYSGGAGYQVKHAAITDIGCVSDTAIKTVEISELPVATFALSGSICEDRVISFNDGSSTSSGKLAKWAWDFGDGTTLNRTSAGNIEHTYSDPGNYNVTLQVFTEGGCKSSIFNKPITVGAVPQTKFGMPEVCLSDPFAQFFDSSTIQDQTESSFVYLWNFGDGGSSLEKNPKHVYAAVGTYNVQLRVTSGQGCIKDTVQQFTVNGTNPKAEFTFNSSSEICSNEEITIVDGSTVDIGNIVKIEVYWDYLRDPLNKTTDENPSPGKSYSHKYPEFGNPSSVQYQIRYVVYSGISCVSQITRMITLKARPEIRFNDLDPVCEEAAPFQISTATEVTGLVGTAVFSGAGISSSGLFSPLLAKPGLHPIRYTYHAGNGCSSYAEESILVNPTPEVDAGPDRTVLEGGFIVLQAKAIGSGINYLWIPNTNINDNNIATPQVSPIDDTEYTLTVTTSEGCTASDQVVVKVLKEPKVPNAFSPNGDGINDKWFIQFLDSYPGCTVDVFNRYGQIVFRSVGYDNPWDGTMNGKPLAVGTYYFIINPKNGRKQMNGSITLIR